MELGFVLTKAYCHIEGGTWAEGVGLFENRMLRRIFGSKRGEVTGEW